MSGNRNNSFNLFGQELSRELAPIPSEFKDDNQLKSLIATYDNIVQNPQAKLILAVLIQLKEFVGFSDPAQQPDNLTTIRMTRWENLKNSVIALRGAKIFVTDKEIAERENVINFAKTLITQKNNALKAVHPQHPLVRADLNFFYQTNPSAQNTR